MAPRTTRERVTLASLAATTVLVGPLATTAGADEPPDDPVLDSTACDTAEVTIDHGQSTGEVGTYTATDRYVDDDCSVVVEQDAGVVSTADGTTSAVDDPLESLFGSVPATPDPAGAPAPGALAAAQAVTVGNWVHSSQTLLDVINIDIAKFRYLRDRKWNGSSSWWGAGWFAGYTEKSWNHPVSVQHHWTEGAAIASSTQASGDFHSDFLWCNLQEGQNFRLTTTMITFKNGDRDARFTQSRTCSGTHMATEVKTSLSDQW